MQLLLALILIILVAGLVYSILYTLGFALQRLRAAPTQVRKLQWYVGLGLGFWLLTVGLVAWNGAFMNFESSPPRMLLVSLPVLLSSFLLLRSRLFISCLKAIPRSWLLFGQTYRVFLELLLWFGFTIGMVPFHLTFVGFNYDIVVGLTAIPAGLLFFRKGRLLRFEAIVWNTFGLILLLYNGFIFLISLPYSFQVFDIEPSNSFMTQFPFIWIPAFLVPLAAALHLFSLSQLMLPEQRRRFSLRRKT